MTVRARKCWWCGTQFQGNAGAHYCSRICRQAAWRDRKAAARETETKR